MASDQLKGAIVTIYAENPTGDRKVLFSGVNEQTGPGGSPEGVQATVKDNELAMMPMNPTPVNGGSKIILAMKLKTADGSDASDCIANVPVRDASGSLRYLTLADFGHTVDFPASTPADVMLDCGTGYTVTEGQTLRIGGGKMFISLENDV